MTEEIIIDGVNVAGCKYCDVIRYTYPTEGLNIECYADYQNEMVDNCKGKTTCYYKQLKRLEQENKELKEVKEQLKKWFDENLKRQDDMQLWIDLAEEQRSKYRSALEEINITVKQLLQGVSSNCINNTPYLTALSLIQNRINEVLQ